MAARYLLRFDDICPTMNWTVWRQVEEILQEHRVRPMLAVIPDNCDPHLVQAPPVPDFWDRVRDWHASGWTIGMHGYQHRYTSRDCGLLRLNRYSEFSGSNYNDQYTKLAAGRRILEAEGIQPELFIAPAHSFDWTTVQALAQLGFRYISDGFTLLPIVDHFGITWLPQQLWSFRSRPFGTWTICLHINSWKQSDVDIFRTGMLRYLPAIADMHTILGHSEACLTPGLNRLSGIAYGEAIHVKSRIDRILHPPLRAQDSPDLPGLFPRQ